MRFQKKPILLAGEGKLIEGIMLCLLKAGHHVWFWPNEHFLAPSADTSYSLPETILNDRNFHPVSKLEEIPEIKIAVAVTPEDLQLKREMVVTLEKSLSRDGLIAINSESIPLNQIQEISALPERIIGLNWTEPANTTFFLEVVSNSANRKEDIEDLVILAKRDWAKDPYVLKNGEGIRAKLLAALVREAFYLIENGYVGVEDVDRACRNDAGYYLPFAGNCRYMDLMGTWAYGTVMADLNPELSNASHIPDFFKQIIKDGGKGIENGSGFYQYSITDKKAILESFKEFSLEIKTLMSKYPTGNI